MPRPTNPVRLVLLPMCLAALLAGCAGGVDAVTASKESNTRPSAPTDDTTSDDPGDGGVPADTAFCSALSALATGQGAPLGTDPAGAVEAMSALGDIAPPQLRDDFATLASVVGDLTALDGSDPASVGRALEIVLRPDVLAATDAIDAYAKDTCGVDLGTTSGGATTTTSVPTADGSGTTGSGDIDLEDLDAVRHAHESETWPAKLSSTTILNDADVTLSADDSDLLTAAEGLAACTAVRAALVTINPQVVVTIKSGATTVATAPAGGECAAA